MSIASWWNQAVEIFGLADIVRSWFPLQWRAWLSPWLIWGGVFVTLALICTLVHFVARPRPKIEWLFEKTGVPIIVNDNWGSKGYSPTIVGIFFQGENVSGHDLHQFDGEIILERPVEKLPLYVPAPKGDWGPITDIDRLPSRVLITFGARFAPDVPNWEGFEKPLSPSDFLRDFGAFTLVITVDGERRTWSFSLEELRKQFEAQKREHEERRLTDPAYRPLILMKTQSRNMQ